MCNQSNDSVKCVLYPERWYNMLTHGEVSIISLIYYHNMSWSDLCLFIVALLQKWSSVKAVTGVYQNTLCLCLTTMHTCVCGHNVAITRQLPCLWSFCFGNWYHHWHWFIILFSGVEFIFNLFFLSYASVWSFLNNNIMSQEVISYNLSLFFSQIQKLIELYTIELYRHSIAISVGGTNKYSLPY